MSKEKTLGEVREIKIDDEFKVLFNNLTEDERSELLASIKSEGCREPLIIWREENILLDGHNRKAICEAYKIPYSIKSLSFADRETARAWIIKNQIGRRNLSDTDMTLSLGKLYIAQKQEQGGKRGNQYTKVASAQNGHLPKSSGQNDHLPKSSGDKCGKSDKTTSAQNDHKSTAQKLAEDHGVSPITVRRAAELAEAVEMVKSVEPGIEELLKHNVVKKKDVIAAAAYVEHNPKYAKAILEGDYGYIPKDGEMQNSTRNLVQRAIDLMIKISKDDLEAWETALKDVAHWIRSQLRQEKEKQQTQEEK